MLNRITQRGKKFKNQNSVFIITINCFGNALNLHSTQYSINHIYQTFEQSQLVKLKYLN
jgi:hypothetical protein